MSAFLRIGDNIVTRALVRVPNVGPWYADVDLEGDPDLSGSQTLSIGDTLDLVGTVDPRFNGTFALQRRLRLVGGAGGWGKKIPPRGYHNDSGVRARLVAEDAARDAGETLAAFNGADTLGKDFARMEGAASITLEQAAGGVPWWVDYSGRTHVESRPPSTPAGTAYEVLDVDPRARLVTLAVDDPSAVQIGAMLTERLDAPLVVRELHIEATDVLRLKAWCGPVDATLGRLLDAFRGIVRREVAGRIYGPIRYRVVRMNVARYELQVVRRGSGAPDLVPLSAWPGVAGSHSVAQLGAEVLVQFIEGDPGQPVVTHFAGKDGAGWIPVEAILAASSLVRLGSDTANRALALATETKSALDSLQNAHDTHKHPIVSGATVVPDVLVGPIGPIASTKVVTDG